MYHLYKIESDKFNLKIFSGKEWTGNRAQIIARLLSYNFEEHEIFLAFSALEEEGQDYAEFGVFKKFIFSHNLEKMLAERRSRRTG